MSESCTCVSECSFRIQYGSRFARWSEFLKPVGRLESCSHEPNSIGRFVRANQVLYVSWLFVIRFYVSVQWNVNTWARSERTTGQMSVRLSRFLHGGKKKKWRSRKLTLPRLSSARICQNDLARWRNEFTVNQSLNSLSIISLNWTALCFSLMERCGHEKISTEV